MVDADGAGVTVICDAKEVRSSSIVVGGADAGDAAPELVVVEACLNREL